MFTMDDSGAAVVVAPGVRSCIFYIPATTKQLPSRSDLRTTKDKGIHIPLSVFVGKGTSHMSV
jgi:hypothetical protein